MSDVPMVIIHPTIFAYLGIPEHGHMVSGYSIQTDCTCDAKLGIYISGLFSDANRKATAEFNGSHGSQLYWNQGLIELAAVWSCSTPTTN